MAPVDVYDSGSVATVSGRGFAAARERETSCPVGRASSRRLAASLPGPPSDGAFAVVRGRKDEMVMIYSVRAYTLQRALPEQGL